MWLHAAVYRIAPYRREREREDACYASSMVEGLLYIYIEMCVVGGVGWKVEAVCVIYVTSFLCIDMVKFVESRGKRVMRNGG